MVLFVVIMNHSMLLQIKFRQYFYASMHHLKTSVTHLTVWGYFRTVNCRQNVLTIGGLCCFGPVVVGRLSFLRIDKVSNKIIRNILNALRV